jgi:hypothetical protein
MLPADNAQVPHGHGAVLSVWMLPMICVFSTSAWRELAPFTVPPTRASASMRTAAFPLTSTSLLTRVPVSLQLARDAQVIIILAPTALRPRPATPFCHIIIRDIRYTMLSDDFHFRAVQLAAPPVVEFDLDLVEAVLRLEPELDEAVVELGAGVAAFNSNVRLDTASILDPVMGTRLLQTNFLVGFNLDASRFAMESFGEDRPLDPAHNESAWSRNRRAAFAVLSGM